MILRKYEKSPGCSFSPLDWVLEWFEEINEDKMGEAGREIAPFIQTVGSITDYAVKSDLFIAGYEYLQGEHRPTGMSH